MLLSLPAGCGLFWEPRWDYQTASWQGPDVVIEMHSGYEEKKSFDPMAGTTLKRNFQTRLQRVLVGNGIRFEGVSTPAAGQALEDLYTIHDWYYFIVRSPSNPGEHSLVRVSSDMKAQERIDFQGLPPLQKLLPSPDRSKVALLFEENGNARIHVVKAEQITTQARASKAVSTSGAIQWTWSSDSRELYILTEGSVLAFDGAASRKAGRFPVCFDPGTSWAGRIGDQGILYDRSTLEDQPRLERVPHWRRHGAFPLTSDAARVGADCN